MTTKYRAYQEDSHRLAFIIDFLDSPATRRIDNFCLADGRRILIERMADGRVVIEYLNFYHTKF